MPGPLAIAAIAGAAAGAAALAWKREQNRLWRESGGQLPEPYQGQKDGGPLAAGERVGLVERGVPGRGFVPARRTIEGNVTPHWGHDITAARGTPVFAARAGTVAYVGRRSGYGNTIFIHHPDVGKSTLYGHLDSTAVRVGQQVQAGERIGAVGSTTMDANGVEPSWVIARNRAGRPMGPHLHFEVHPQASGAPNLATTYVRDDPVAWMAANGVAPVRAQDQTQVASAWEEDWESVVV